MPVLRLKFAVAGRYNEEKEHHCEHQSVELHLHSLFFSDIQFLDVRLFRYRIERKKD